MYVLPGKAGIAPRWVAFASPDSGEHPGGTGEAKGRIRGYFLN